MVRHQSVKGYLLVFLCKTIYYQFNKYLAVRKLIENTFVSYLFSTSHCKDLSNWLRFKYSWFAIFMPGSRVIPLALWSLLLIVVIILFVLVITHFSSKFYLLAVPSKLQDWQKNIVHCWGSRTFLIINRMSIVLVQYLSRNCRLIQFFYTESTLI